MSAITIADSAANISAMSSFVRDIAETMLSYKGSRMAVSDISGRSASRLRNAGLSSLSNPFNIRVGLAQNSDHVHGRYVSIGESLVSNCFSITVNGTGADMLFGAHPFLYAIAGTKEERPSTYRDVHDEIRTREVEATSAIADALSEVVSQHDGKLSIHTTKEKMVEDGYVVDHVPGRRVRQVFDRSSLEVYQSPIDGKWFNVDVAQPDTTYGPLILMAPELFNARIRFIGDRYITIETEAPPLTLVRSQSGHKLAIFVGDERSVTMRLSNAMPASVANLGDTLFNQLWPAIADSYGKTAINIGLTWLLKPHPSVITTETADRLRSEVESFGPGETAVTAGSHRTLKPKTVMSAMWQVNKSGVPLVPPSFVRNGEDLAVQFPDDVPFMLALAVGMMPPPDHGNERTHVSDPFLGDQIATSQADNPVGPVPVLTSPTG